MAATLRDVVIEIRALHVAVGDECVAHRRGFSEAVADGTGIDVELRGHFSAVLRDFLRQRLVVPPEGAGHARHLGEHVRAVAPGMERHQTAQRRADGGGVLAPAEGAVVGVDVGLDRGGHEVEVLVGTAAAVACVAARCVLVDPIGAGVVDADDDHLVHQAAADQLVRSFIHAPFLAAEGGRRLEQVLAVVSIEHGIALERVLVVARRQVQDQGAGVVELRRMEAGDFLQAAGGRAEERIDIDGGAGFDDVVRADRPGGVVLQWFDFHVAGGVRPRQCPCITGGPGGIDTGCPGQGRLAAAETDAVAVADVVVDADGGGARR